MQSKSGNSIHRGNYTKGRILRNSRGRGRVITQARHGGDAPLRGRGRGGLRTGRGQGALKTRRGRGALTRGHGRGSLSMARGRGTLKERRGRGSSSRARGRGKLKERPGRGTSKEDYHNSPFLRDPETFPDSYKLKANHERGDLLTWISRLKPYLISYIPEILECIVAHKTYLTSTGFLAIMITHARKYRRRKTQARWLTDGVIMVLLPFVQNKLDKLQGIIRSMVLHDFCWGNYSCRRHGIGQSIIVDQIKIQTPFLRLFDEDEVFNALQPIQKGKLAIKCEDSSMNDAYEVPIIDKENKYIIQKMKRGYQMKFQSETYELKNQELENIHATVIQKFHRNRMPFDVVFDIKVIPLTYTYEEGLYDEMMKTLKQAVVDDKLDEVLKKMNQQDLILRHEGHNLHFNHRFFHCKRCKYLWMSNSYSADQICGQCESPGTEVLSLPMHGLSPRQQRIFVNGGTHWSKHCVECMRTDGNCKEKANERVESSRLQELVQNKKFCNKAAKRATQSDWMRSVWGKYRKVKVHDLQFAIVIGVNPEYGEKPPEKQTSSKPKDDFWET